MLNMINISLPLKKIFSVELIKIYFLTLCVFLIAKTDSYACNDDNQGHIKFHNGTNIPIDIVVSYIKNEKSVVGKCLRKNSETKECELRSDSDFKHVINEMVSDKKFTVRAKTTSGGQCWVEDNDDHTKLSYFKTFFKYNDKTVQGPAGEIGVTTHGMVAFARGRVRKHEGNQEYITSSACKKKYSICTVDLKFKKKK